MHRRTLSFLASPLVAGAAAALSLVAGVPAPTHADTPAPCDRQYLYLHDMAGTADEMTSFASTVGTPTACTVVADYGRTRLTRLVTDAGGPATAGFTAIDDSADEIAGVMRSRQHSESRGWTVIAHGAGALVAQRVVQMQAIDEPITDIVAVGPMWQGTNIGFLADTEDISRRLGTYDAVLRLEKPLIDPWCEGCRELVRGSDVLVAMRRAGIPSPGVDYTNVISPTDGLVSDPMSAALRGMNNRILNPAHTGGLAHHFALLSEPAVASMVRTAVSATQ